MNKTTQQAIFAHALTCYPCECCGLIVDGDYYPCVNVATEPQAQFEIDPVEYLRLSELGEIQAIVHSHPNGEPLPSEVDLVQMSLHDVPWVIVSVNDGKCQMQTHKPTSYISPLVGREYHHGLQDCYSLVRDYYSRELDIVLPDFKRCDEWWENPSHEPLYENNFGKAGFRALNHNETLQTHDVILCRVGRTHHINHALIYLGDYQLQSENSPTYANHLVLHHPHSRLSVREVYGESWQRRTALVVRYKQIHKG